MARHSRRRRHARRVRHRKSMRRRSPRRLNVVCDGKRVYSGKPKMATVVAKAASKAAGGCDAVVGGRESRWGKSFWKKSPSELEAKAGRVVASYSHGKRIRARG